MDPESTEVETDDHMRAVTFTLDQPDGQHFAYRMFGVDSEFEREEIYHLNVLADETVILLGRL